MDFRQRGGFIYHIYPLGLLPCPRRNPGLGAQEGKLLELIPWLDHAASLGASAVWLGPLFESTSHGYDTTDYGRVDSRLGTNADLRALVDAAHRLGLAVILDAVFNHTGREHPRFQEMVRERRAPAGGPWYKDVDFGRPGPDGIPFSYQGWAGCMDLAKLDLDNPQARDHVIGAALSWIREFDIDGLRLDAADVLPFPFMAELGRQCRSAKEGFWLLGEVVHGDYARWIREGGLDSVTNYECYKGLYSSFNDRNLHEIAHSLKRQFGEGGIYRGMDLYSFADNHDVSRIASALADPAALHPLHVLLFTMPGIPSVYYGSEWGIEGGKGRDGDWNLRPALELPPPGRPRPDLPDTIRRLARLRAGSAALRTGDYRELSVGPEALAFLREGGGERVAVAVNASEEWRELPLGPASASSWEDLLDRDLPPPRFEAGKAVVSVPPRWGRVLAVR